MFSRSIPALVLLAGVLAAGCKQTCIINDDCRSGDVCNEEGKCVPSVHALPNDDIASDGGASMDLPCNAHACVDVPEAPNGWDDPPG